jgi:hypothetical protein
MDFELFAAFREGGRQPLFLGGEQRSHVGEGLSGSNHNAAQRLDMPIEFFHRARQRGLLLLDPPAELAANANNTSLCRSLDQRFLLGTE